MTTQKVQSVTINKYSLIEKNDELDDLDKLTQMYDNMEKTNKYAKPNIENKPKNYGNKWTNDDKKTLITMLKQNKETEINYKNMGELLGRSEGGIKAEIKKMIITKYFNGECIENICIELNMQYKYVKPLINSYIENEINIDINNLEKENKLFKLKIENIELRKNMYNLYKNQ
jgi:hypothetical protein